jgi:hypothetical protein
MDTSDGASRLRVATPQQTAAFPVATLLPFVAAAFGSVASLKFLPIPWFWALLVWVAAFALAAVHARTTNARAVAVNAGVLMAVMAGFELFGYVNLSSTSAVERTYSDGYKSRDDAIGSRPAPNVVGHSELRDGNRTIYSVDYTIGSDGLRVAPPVAAEPLLGCILFFGDSFTFGEGVSDTQTVPYQVGLMTGGRYRVYNFSFHGYGPEQMLATLQLGLYRDVVNCEPTHVIYQALVDHAARAAGVYYWNDGAPRYRLQPNGTVVAAGHYGDERVESASFVARNLDYQLSKSYFALWLGRRNRQPTMADVDLWLGIVAASRDYVHQHFPASEYHVLFWDDRPSSEETVRQLALTMQRRLQKEGIAFDVVQSILPDYDRLHANYELDPIDTHPNSTADEIIARYVVTHVLRAVATQ